MSSSATERLKAICSSPAAALVSYGLSVALHGGLFAAILLFRPMAPDAGSPVSIEIVERVPPPPQVEPSEPVQPRAPQVATRPTAPATRPRDSAPPPPNDRPPSDAKPTPIRIGLSMSSTTTAGGGMAVPTGNTLYGKPPERVKDDTPPAPYRADRYVAPTQVASLPVLLSCDVPKSEYPEEAKREGFEGDVLLRLVVDAEGRVLEAVLVKDPGMGLGAAAVRQAKRFCRFRPAKRDGQPVATEIPYTMRYVLE